MNYRIQNLEKEISELQEDLDTEKENCKKNKLASFSAKLICDKAEKHAQDYRDQLDRALRELMREKDFK